MRSFARSMTLAWNYLKAALITSLALTITLLIWRKPHEENGQYMLFLGAVAISSLLGGVSAGAFSLFLSALAIVVFFVEPYGELGSAGFRDTIWLLAFFLVSGITIWLGASLRRVRDQAFSEARARQAVLAIVAHDLKNPLSSIQTSVDLCEKGLLSGTPPKDTQIKLLKTTRGATNQMLRLIQDLLDTSAIENKRLSLHPGEVRASDLVADVAALFQAMATEKSVDLVVKPECGACRVWCDRDRMAQVLSNLLGNALKFTPAGGRVEIRVGDYGTQLVFSVQDTGPGIPENDLPRIFERYWKVPGTGKPGSGLGLYISKGIVEAHGGKIWAENQPGGGAVFFFTLPKV